MHRAAAHARRFVVATVAPLSALAVLTVSPAAFSQTRDSAGVRIVDNARPLWTAGTGLRVSAAPAVVIGNQDGEAYELDEVGGAVRLADGTIVVANGSTHQLRFYDRTGRHIRSVGRQGAGPGEFNSLSFIRKLAGDTIAAADGFRQVSYFTSAGVFVRSTMLGAGGGGPPTAMLLAVLDDQSTVAGPMVHPTPRPNGERWLEMIPVTLTTRTSGRPVSLGTHPFASARMHEGRGYPLRFTDYLQVATDGSDIFIGFGNEYSIRVYSSDGRLERIIRRRWTPRRVTSEEIDSYAERWGRDWIRATGADYQRELREFRQTPFAESVPAFSQVLADRLGRLWVREALIADASATGELSGMPRVPSTWSVFDPEGRWLGDITTPARFQVHEFGADYVLGVTRDADGVEMVALYSLSQTE